MTYVIIGNGTAGINAAVTIRRRDPRARICIISDETRYYYSRTALMYIAMGHMRLEDTRPLEPRFYTAHRLELMFETVTSIDTQAKRVQLSRGDTIAYDKLLIATGSVAAMHGWEGSDLDGVVAFVLYQDLQDVLRAIPRTKKAVVVGGGLIGIELVEVFRSAGIDVTFLIRGATFWDKALSEQEGRMVERHMRDDHGVDVQTNASLERIRGSGGRVQGITTTDGREIACDTVGVTTGVRPNIEMASRSGIPCKKGVLVNDRLQTHIPDVFAAGDCVEIEKPMQARNFIMSIWYLARDMGGVAADNMLGDDRAYTMGPWYNSAKFFDLEYTSAGKFMPTQPDEHDYMVWGIDGKRSVRIVHNDTRVIGFSMIGARWDHEVLLSCIENRLSLAQAVQQLPAAFFDPEFHAFERAFTLPGETSV